MLVDVAPTMWPGSEFHASITRLEKKTSVVLKGHCIEFGVV